MQIAYENAYTCQYYGEGKDNWLKAHDELSKEDLDMAWKQAFNDLAEEKACTWVFATNEDFSEMRKVIEEEKCQ